MTSTTIKSTTNQHNMSRSLPPYQETYLRRKQARSDLRLSDASTAASLDGEDRAYFRHIYVKRAERKVREMLGALAANPRLPQATRAYLAHLVALGRTENIQPRFLQAILNIETQGEGTEEREQEVEEMFAEESTMM